MVTVALALTVLSAPPAVLEEEILAPRPHTIEVGIGSGAFLPAVGPRGMDPRAETGLAVGLRLAYLPWSFAGVEAEVLHLASRQGSTDVGGYAARGHLLFQLPGRLAPFVLGGAGVLGRPTDGDPQSTVATHWGGGLRWFTHPNVNVRLEARHVLAFPGEQVRQDFEATIGFGFSLFAVDESPSLLSEVAGTSRQVASVR